MSKVENIYGDFAVAPKGSIPSIHMNHLMGFSVGRRPDGQPAGMDLQFQSQGQIHSVTIPLLEAMALLSMLKSFQLNEDLPFPEDPRDPNWTASQYVKKKP